MSVDAAASNAAGGPSYAQRFGPVFWGFCLSLMLCGVSALQGYLYFSRYNDKLGVRLLATMMLVLDFLSMALICQSIYYYIFPDFGSSAPLDTITKELVVECLISAVITFTYAQFRLPTFPFCAMTERCTKKSSQMYFSYQLYIIGSSPGQTATVMNAFVIAFGTLGFGGALGTFPGVVQMGVMILTTSIGCSTLMFMHPQAIFLNRNHTFAIFAGVSKVCDAAADLIATFAMCIFLKSTNTGISLNSSLLRSLMHLVINRGLLVTAAQIVLLITFFASVGHLYWLAVHINTTKLYVNTFFAMLNARSTPESELNAESTNSRSEPTRVSPLLAAKKKASVLDALGAIRLGVSSDVPDV
ncbi:hypothetical protein C8R44DRAFT_990706 [Mycena epipterygia]|nr:hypothetical protein C8R44DRAFT_990706 [Mycena epipterygia]